MDLGGVLSYSFIKECRFGGVSGCFAVVSRRFAPARLVDAAAVFWRRQFS